MKKKYIHIYQCKPGDILADDLYDDCGILIVLKDVVINEHVIKMVKTFRIRQLSVYELQNVENSEKGGSSLDEFKKDYQKDLNVMKQVLGDLAAGRKPDYEKVECISNSICSKRNHGDGSLDSR